MGGAILSQGDYVPAAAPAAAGWLLDGNTNGAEKYIGTNDDFSFPVRINTHEVWAFENNGGIGTGLQGVGAISRNGSLWSVVDGTTTTWGQNAGLNVSGAANTFIGYQAGNAMTTGTNCTIVGSQAGLVNTAVSCVFVGKGAGILNTSGINQTFVGTSAGNNTTGKENTLMGYHAGQVNTTGVSNIAIGVAAGTSLFSGIGASAQDCNIFIGHAAGDGISTGSFNLFIGQSAGWNGTTATRNIIIGNAVVLSAYGGGNVTNSFSGAGITDSIAIGNLTTITASNQLVIGSPTLFINQEQHYYSATGVQAVYYRTATPEGAQTGNPGDFSIVNDATTGSLYIKRFGAASNTGWIALGTEGIIFTQTNSVTVGNITTEGTLIGTGVGTTTIIANYLTVGKTIVVYLKGFITDTGTPNIQFRLKLGGTAVLDSGVVAMSAITGTQYFEVYAEITIRTVGAVGSAIGQGTVFITRNTTTSINFNLTNTATFAIDTTAALAVDLTVQWGTANASNTLTSTNCYIEYKN